MSQDVVEHFHRPQQNIVIPIAQHPEAMCRKHSRSRLIRLCALDVLAAIELNDQLQLGTKKVGDKARNRHLPAKPQTRQLAQPQIAPQMPLGIGGVVA